MIRFNHVTRSFAKGGKALDDVSFHVDKGEFVFLTGHSGSGKTTSLRMIHLADRPTDGEVRVMGFSSRLTSPRDVWKLRRRVGCVFQDFRLLPNRTAAENVAFALEVTGTPRKEIVPRTQRLLGQVGLSARSGAPVHELSGGEQQRVGIARAIANEPMVLLADEPTGNLDEGAARAILRLIQDLNTAGMAVVMATHDLDLVRAYPGARILELAHGRVAYDSGSPAAEVTT